MNTITLENEILQGAETIAKYTKEVNKATARLISGFVAKHIEKMAPTMKAYAKMPATSEINAVMTYNQAVRTIKSEIDKYL